MITLDYTNFVQAEVSVKGLFGKDYVLKGASAGSGLAFRATLADNMTYGPNGKIQSLDGKIIGAEPAVLGTNLYLVLDDGSTSKTPVGADFIKRLPDEIQSGLFTSLKEITPTLYGPKKDTVESLTKEIERLQAKLEKVREKEDIGLKNS